MYRVSIIAACMSCLAIGASLAQVSEEERAALEERQRQIRIARALANQTQITIYDLDGNALRTVGEPGSGLSPSLLFSPDRSRILASRRDPRTQDSDLLVIDVETGAESTLARTDDGESPRDPVWSPDGRELAFVRPGGRFTIHRRRIDGDPNDGSQVVYSHSGGPIRLGDWSLDGRYLLFSGGALESESVIYRLDLESGGDPVAVFRADRPLSSPLFSPDGRYVSFSSIDETGIRYHVTHATPATGDRQKESWELPATGSPFAGFWDSDDPVFYQIEVSDEQDGPRLMAIPVDTSGDFELGEPNLVATIADIPGAAMMNLSRDGELFVGTSRPDQPQLEPPLITMLDRDGEVVGRFGEPGRDSGPSFSPDGTRILAFRSNTEAFSSSLMTFDVASGEATAVAEIEGGVVRANAVWTSDGQHIVYSAATLATIGDPDFSPTYYRKRADSGGDNETVFRAPPGLIVLNLADISPDDEFLLFESAGVVQTVRLTGNDALAREGLDILRGEFEFELPRFSPDMRYLAYTYNESGREEVYLTPFDAETGTASENERHRVSRGGTVGGPTWREDGEELYYLREMFETPALNDFEVMAVSVALQPALEIGTPRGLFEISAARMTGTVRLQDVSPDGERFLFMLPAPSE